MSELISQMWTSEMSMVLTVLVGCVIALYVLSIVWVARDAFGRGSLWPIWTILALIPIVGVIAYLLLRPPLMKIDHEEQELEIALKQRQLMHYGNCGNCGYPVEHDYLLCPNCHQRLKNQCSRCGHALDPAWTVCPYCATPVNQGRPARSSQVAGQAGGAHQAK